MPVIVRESRARPTRTPATDTGTMHYPGTFPRGPLTPTEVKSEADLTRLFGPRWASSQDPDMVIAFFRLGGSRALIKRRVGPAAAAATVTLSKGGNQSLIFTADSLGATGNDIRVKVDADTGAGTAVITLSRITAGDALVETSPPLASQAEAAAWSIGATLGTLEPATSGSQPQWPPTTIAAAAATGGSDDLAGVTDSTYAADIALFDRKTGPGQIPAAGKTSSTVRNALLAVAAGEANKRVILDPVAGTVATNASGSALTDGIALAAAMRTIAGSARAAMYRGRLIVQGYVSGTYLTLPWSVVQCAQLSRNDAALGNTNEAAAGIYGDPRGLPNNVGGAASYVLGVLDASTDADIAAMQGTGLNPVIDANGDGETIQVDGDETLAGPLDPTAAQFANSRTAMLAKARGYQLAARRAHRQVDAGGVIAGQYAGDLIGMLGGLQRIGAIYGTDADPGYIVDTGPGVNTPETIAARQLRARIGLRFSPGATFVYLDVVYYAVNEPVA